ncbi:MAG: hypothetical protein ACYTGH_18675 [Planctomycetota bacterium]|jgi:hypothetical protein
MTKLLEQAFQKASELPDSVQDLLAQEVMDEILWEMKWDKELESKSPMLQNMAQKALEDYKNGKTESKGFDQL